MSEKKAPTYPVKTIALLLKVTERRVQQLAQEGVIPRGDRGRYELAGSVQGYIAFLQNKVALIDEDGKGFDYNKEKARKTKAEADIAEMEADKMRGGLVSAQEVSSALSLIISEVRSNLLNNTPTRIASRAKSEKTAAAIKGIAKEEITAALLVLSTASSEKLTGDAS
ncbi:terminase small subunit, Nu1 [Falsihalocynthiibacter arcticus]|uniref:terminase small subunit, Nu1 n=1 Tax=Falsihalocynthiibacter arcticus TaxID=1579316 RepID=UPI0030022C08